MDFPGKFNDGKTTEGAMLFSGINQETIKKNGMLSVNHSGYL